MFAFGGIAVDSWVRIHRDCPIAWTVIGDEAQFELGPSSATLTLVASEDGVAALATMASEALRAIRARPQTGVTRGTVPPDDVSS